MILIKAFIIILLIAIIFLKNKNETYVVSNIDYREYSVAAEYDDTQEAANLLAQVNKFNLDLIDYMLKKYQDNPESHKYQLALRLSQRYDPDVLREHDTDDKTETAFTSNKGQELAMCLREKKTGRGEFHDLNLLMFISTHELSHIASIGYGHGSDEFWPNFAIILNEAKEMGQYKPVDFSVAPDTFCNLDISYNPMYDPEYAHLIK